MVKSLSAVTTGAGLSYPNGVTQFEWEAYAKRHGIGSSPQSIRDIAARAGTTYKAISTRLLRAEEKLDSPPRPKVSSFPGHWRCEVANPQNVAARRQECASLPIRQLTAYQDSVICGVFGIGVSARPLEQIARELWPECVSGHRMVHRCFRVGLNHLNLSVPSESDRIRMIQGLPVPEIWETKMATRNLVACRMRLRNHLLLPLEREILSRRWGLNGFPLQGEAEAIAAACCTDKQSYVALKNGYRKLALSSPTPGYTKALKCHPLEPVLTEVVFLGSQVVYQVGNGPVETQTIRSTTEMAPKGIVVVQKPKMVYEINYVPSANFSAEADASQNPISTASEIGRGLIGYHAGQTTLGGVEIISVSNDNNLHIDVLIDPMIPLEERLGHFGMAHELDRNLVNRILERHPL